MTVWLLMLGSLSSEELENLYQFYYAATLLNRQMVEIRGAESVAKHSEREDRANDLVGMILKTGKISAARKKEIEEGVHATILELNRTRDPHITVSTE